MPQTQTATKPVVSIFSDLDEEFNDTIALFEETTQLHLDRLVALQSK